MGSFKALCPLCRIFVNFVLGIIKHKVHKGLHKVHKVRIEHCS